MGSALSKLSQSELIERLDVIQEVSIELIKGGDNKALMKLIVEKAMELTIADGGSLYLLNENKDHLVFEVLINNTFETKDFDKFQIPLTKNSMATYAFNNCEALNIPDVYLLENDLDYRFNDSLDKMIDYRTKSMLVLPLVDSNGEAIGVIQLINRKKFFKEEWPKTFGEVSSMPPFSSADQEIVKRFSVLASTSMSKFSFEDEELPPEFDINKKNYLF